MSAKYVNRGHQQENICIYQQRFRYTIIIHISLVLENQHVIVNIVSWSAHRKLTVEKGPQFSQIYAKPENFKLNRLM